MCMEIQQITDQNKPEENSFRSGILHVLELVLLAFHVPLMTSDLTSLVFPEISHWLQEGKTGIVSFPFRTSLHLGLIFGISLILTKMTILIFKD